MACLSVLYVLNMFWPRECAVLKVAKGRHWHGCILCLKFGSGAGNVGMTDVPSANRERLMRLQAGVLTSSSRASIECLKRRPTVKLLVPTRTAALQPLLSRQFDSIHGMSSSAIVKSMFANTLSEAAR